MIELRRLQKVIEQNTVIDIEALTVAAGEIVALVGPVGSGKEPLLELLIGRERPTVGEVTLAGANPISNRHEFSRQVGVLFSEDTLYQRQSSKSNLAFHCRLRGLPKSRVEEVLVKVGLADRANERVDRLSSGLARRLALGCAIVHQPKVLLLVEPFDRCDDATITLFGTLMRELADDGVALLILADNSSNLTALCDTIVTLENGRIVDVSRPAEDQQRELPFKIPVRLEGSVALVNPADILYALTQDGRTFLQTIDGRLPTQFTMAQLEERLSRSGFFRAHRGFLVNLQHVKEVIPYTRSSFSLKLNDADETKIPLSKEAARELRDLLGY
jgi:ABC-2 type transport system ATP-binding protein